MQHAVACMQVQKKHLRFRLRGFYQSNQSNPLATGMNIMKTRWGSSRGSIWWVRSTEGGSIDWQGGFDRTSRTPPATGLYYIQFWNSIKSNQIKNHLLYQATKQNK